MVPGTFFRERAENGSIVMFCAKHIYDNNPPVTALSQLKKISDALPNRYFISFYKGLCHLAMGAPDKALAQLENALSQNPSAQDIPTICSYAGVCLKEMERYKDALAILRKRALHWTMNGKTSLISWASATSCSSSIPIPSACFHRVLELKPGSAIDHCQHCLQLPGAGRDGNGHGFL